MQFVVHLFLTPLERKVQHHINHHVRAVNREINARALQENFQSETYNPILGLMVHLANDSRYPHLMSMSSNELNRYKQYCEKIVTSRTEIRKLTEKMSKSDLIVKKLFTDS